MRQAVIVSYARTPIAKAYRGAFNDTDAAALSGHAVAHAVERARVDPSSVEDLVLGCASQQGNQGYNLGRLTVASSGLPLEVAGMTIDRQCASGLTALSIAARQVMFDQMDVVVAAGVESISLTQTQHKGNYRTRSQSVLDRAPHMWMSMIETAEVVAERYGVTREAQDTFALESQQRTARAQAEGRFDAEIVPLATRKVVTDKASGETRSEDVRLTKDEGPRADTTLEGLQSLAPVFKNGELIAQGAHVTAGNASQLSDGAAALVVMEAKAAEAAGLSPLGAFKGLAVAGCAPEEMGIGPIYAVPKLLQRHGLTVDDIDLWELNEAFACQALYCRDHLGIDPTRMNVNGGAIALGHPFGMTGARTAGHLLVEGQRRKSRLGVVTMCVGGGMGAAGLFEIF
ncbi:acetyl-CoA C-acyltransferase [Caulobacter sp. Root342]|uniref:acetyl-CoA C-acyltransferase n=1 Tax=Caulobacter sp. Root342 TaxID=1736519 RepID=UPI0006FC3D77|nr:acetyl-CoA C-acyltransferase [Caulobacter sp. Root342]KQV54711.1 acetyl-CoA acetyltransferase [Caulobacter sp. Root342]